MGERIKKIRKSFDMTQQEFGERLGLKRNSISLIESGRNTSDQTVFALCREFNVNEKWLRTGKGDMFVPNRSTELDALRERYPQMLHETYVFIKKLVGLSAENQRVIIDFMREVVRGFDDAPDQEPDIVETPVQMQARLLREEADALEQGKGKSLAIPTIKRQKEA